MLPKTTWAPRSLASAGSEPIRVEDVQVKDRELAVEQHREVGAVVGVARVVVGLAPHLPAVHPAEGVVQRVVDEEVPRLVAGLPVGLRHIAERVEEVAVASAARRPLVIP